jgi:hypothetical protein
MVELRRSCLHVGSCLLPLLCGIATPRAQAPQVDPEPKRAEASLPHDEAQLARLRGEAGAPLALQQGLEWLIAHQDADGRWDCDGFMSHDREGQVCDGAGQATHDVGVTGLALLALLANGSTLREGPWRDSIKRGVMWLREQQDEKSGLFGTASSPTYVYDHAIATLAMVEAYGRSQYKLLRGNAQKGLAYLQSHRNPFGVWRYQPRDGDNDSSVTGWCALALLSGKTHGLEVDPAALSAVRTWFVDLTDPVTGRTGYSERGGWSSRLAGDHVRRFPRQHGECMTALALAVRLRLGDDPEEALIRTQIQVLAQKPPARGAAGEAIDELYWLFGALAFAQLGDGPARTAFGQATLTACVDGRRSDGNFRGSFDPAGVWGEVGGRVFATALACWTLELSLHR